MVMRTMAVTAVTAFLLAGGAAVAHAQAGSGPNGAATTGAAGVSGHRGGAGPNGTSKGTASGAAKARVGAVQGVAREAQKPAPGATGQGDGGTVQGAGAVK